MNTLLTIIKYIQRYNRGATIIYKYSVDSFRLDNTDLVIEQKCKLSSRIISYYHYLYNHFINIIITSN